MNEWWRKWNYLSHDQKTISNHEDEMMMMMIFFLFFSKMVSELIVDLNRNYFLFLLLFFLFFCWEFTFSFCWWIPVNHLYFHLWISIFFHHPLIISVDCEQATWKYMMIISKWFSMKWSIDCTNENFIPIETPATNWWHYWIWWNRR